MRLAGGQEGWPFVHANVCRGRAVGPAPDGVVDLHPNETGQELPDVGRALRRGQVYERDALVEELGEVDALAATSKGQADRLEPQETFRPAHEPHDPVAGFFP